VAYLALPAVTPFGARFLARGNAAVAREQGLKSARSFVEYPSLEKATAVYKIDQGSLTAQVIGNFNASKSEA
jgi:uncharacterized protein (DUF1330 family)